MRADMNTHQTHNTQYDAGHKAFPFLVLIYFKNIQINKICFSGGKCCI